jgi:hypothetical protein
LIGILHNPIKPIVEVRILLRRKEMEAIKEAAEDILLQARAVSISPNGFINSLRSVVAQVHYTTEIDIGRVNPSNTDTSLLMEKLPYKSKTASINIEEFETFSATDQEEFLEEIEKMKKLYGDLLINSSIWKPLNQDDPSEEWVYALPLESLI